MNKMFRECRKAAGMRPESAASALGVSVSTLYHWETGQTSPRVAKLLSMADVYGCSTDDLLGRHKPEVMAARN